MTLPAGVVPQVFERQYGFDSGSDAGGANSGLVWIGNAGDGFLTAFFVAGPLNHTSVTNDRLIGTMTFEIQ